MRHEEFLKQMAELPDAVAALKAEVARLRSDLELAKASLGRPVYDYHALRDIGYSHHESRRILRAYGHKRGGRYRVTQDTLLAYQKGADA